MSNVDKRVVEMQFNNKQFEKDMATTVKSLKNFEKSLEFKNSSKGLDNASKNISKFESKINNMDLSRFESSVEGISSRLSTMGAIAFTTIQNLATDAYNLIKGKFSSLWDTVMAKGMSRALNLEQANFQLMGLLKNEEKVAQVMEDVDYAVSGTAYGLDEAAKVASQLAASNVTAGEYMKNALRGISGVAAMTSSSYEEIGNIFTRVAGQGKVMATDLNSIAARGLNAAATLADFLGTTEAEVREMVSAGAIDFKTFATAMDEAFGEHAKEANKTFTGAMQNVKAALGRIGAGFKQPYIKFMRPVLVQLIQNINAVKDSMAPLFDTVSFVYEKLSNFFISVLKNFVEFRKEGNKEVATIFSLKEAFQKFHDFVVNNWNKAAKVINVLTRTILALFSILKPIIRIASLALSNFIEGLLSLSDGMDEVSKNGSGFIGFISTVKNILESLRAGMSKSSSNIKLIFTSIFGIIGDVFNIILKVTSLIFGSFDNLTDNGTIFYNLISIILSLTASGLKVIKKLTGFIVKIVDLLHPLIKAIVTLTTKFGGFIAVLSTSIFSKVIDLFTSFINKIFDLNISIGSTKEIFTNFGKWIESKFSYAIKIATDGVSWLGDKLDALKNGFTSSGDEAEESGSKVSKYKDKVKEATTSISQTIKENSIFGTAWSKVTGFFKMIWEKIAYAVNFIKEKIKNSGILETVSDTFKKFIAKIKEGFSHLFDSLSTKGTTFTIFDWLKGLIRAIADLVSSLITNLEPAKDALLKMFGANSILDLLQRFVSMYATVNVSNALSAFVRSLQNFVVGINGPIQMIMKNFRRNTTNALKSFATAVLLLSVSIFILSRIDPSALVFTATVLTLFLASFAMIVTQMSKAFKDVKNSATNILTMAVLMKTLGKTVRDVMLSMAIIMLVINNVEVSSVWLSIAVVGAITILMGAFITFFAKIGNSKLKPTQILSFALLIKAMGSAITSIAIVVGILSLFNVEKVKSAGFMVGNIVLLMSAFITLFALIGRSKISATQILSFALLIKAMGSAITGIGIIIGILSLLDQNKVKNVSENIKSIIYLLSLLLGIFALKGTNMRPTQILSFALLIKAMGSAIEGIAFVIGILSLFNPGKISRSLLVVSVITAILTGLVILTKNANGQNMNRSAKSILLISTAIAIFALSVIKLSKIDLLTLVGTVGILTTSIIILGAALVGLSAFSTSLTALSVALLGFGTAAALFGAGVYLIAKSVQILTKLGPQAIQLMTDAITALVSNAPKWIAMFVTGILDAIIQLIPTIAKSLINAIVTVIETMTQSAGTIITAIINLFKAIVTSLAAYRDAFKIEDLFWAINAVALIAGLIYILQVISSDMKSALKGIALMALVLGSIVGALVILNQFTNVDKTIDLVKGLSMALLSLAGVFAIIGIVTTIMNKIAGPKGTIEALLIGIVGFMLFIIAMVAVFGAIGAVINLIGEDAIKAFETSVNVMSKVGQALGSFFGSIVSAFSTIIDNNGLTESMLLAMTPLILALEPLTLALPVLTAFIIGIGATVEAIDEYFNGAATKGLENAIQIMPLIGEALGGFMGSLIGTAAQFASKGLAESITVFGDVLSSFMTKIQPFVNGLSSISGKTLEQAGQLTLIVLEMCAAELITSITDFFTAFTGKRSLADFAKMLADMAPHLVEFSKSLKEGGFNGELANAAANCALTITNVLNNLPRENGLWQVLAGTTIDMDEFGEQLKKFGSSMVEFADSVENITPEQANKIKILLPLVENLVEIANAMPKDGGFWQFLAGTLTDMDEFGEQISKFGISLNDFAKYTSNITIDQANKIKILLPLIESMVDIANAMPKDNGFWQALAGTLTDFDAFGEQLSSFGVSLDAFAKNTSHISESQISTMNNMLPIIESLVDFGNKMAEKDGAWQEIFGKKQSLSDFGDNLGSLGEGIQQFAAYTALISQNNVTSANGALSVMKQIVDMSVLLQENGGIGGALGWLIGSGDQLKKFVDNLPSIGEALSKFAENTSDIDSAEGTQKVANAIKTIAEAFKMSQESGNIKEFIESINSIANLSVDTIKDGFDKRSQELFDAAEKLVDNMLKGFESKKGSITISLASLMLVVKKTIESNTSTKDGLKTMLDKCVKEISKYTQANDNGDFYRTGTQAVDGLVKGIEDNLYKAVDAGRKIGKSALQGTQFSLDIHSPSRAMGNLAHLGILGLVNEFAACSDMVFKSGQDLGNSAMNGTKSIIANLDSAINSDMNLQPVISPVLDLSEVSSQAGLIGGMLNAGTSYRIAGATSSLINQNNANRARTKINQNRSPDVVEAVNALNSRMDSLEQAIINRPIVMDGEKVTKQIAPSMDRALGRRKYYSGRGN